MFNLDVSKILYYLKLLITNILTNSCGSRRRIFARLVFSSRCLNARYIKRKMKLKKLESPKKYRQVSPLKSKRTQHHPLSPSKSTKIDILTKHGQGSPFKIRRKQQNIPLNYSYSVIRERDFAFRWLTSPDVNWDEITLDT